MMKRSKMVHYFVVLVLGAWIGTFARCTVETSNIYFGIMTIFGIIMTALYITEDTDTDKTDKKRTSNNDED